MISYGSDQALLGRTQDTYVWYPTRSGSYSAKSGYAAGYHSIDLYNRWVAVTSINWNKTVWTATCSPKHKLVIWKILHDAIPKGDNLIKRGVTINSICSHCGGTKTIDHLFLHCSFASQVWDLVPLKTPFCSISWSTFASALEASTHWINLPPTGVSGSIFF